MLQSDTGVDFCVASSKVVVCLHVVWPREGQKNEVSFMRMFGVKDLMSLPMHERWYVAAPVNASEMCGHERTVFESTLKTSCIFGFIIVLHSRWVYNSSALETYSFCLFSSQENQRFGTLYMRRASFHKLASCHLFHAKG